jgi:two-component system sensor histidine kinase SenX3
VSFLDAILGMAAVMAVGAVYVANRRRRSLERFVDTALKTMGVPQDPDRGDALVRAVRRMEASVNESKTETAHFRAVVESTDLGVIVVDERGAVTYANPAGRRVLDGEVGDATARNRLNQLIQRVTSSGSPEELTVDVYTPVRRFIRLRAVPLPSEPSVGHAVVVYVRDLSGQRRVEAMRRDFLTNAGHELKTPLGALSVLAETIGDADDPGTRRRLAERLRSEAARMARLVDDIVTLAAIESLETPFVPVRIGEVVDEAVERTAVLSAERGVSIEVEDGDDAVVEGNAEQLTSAVANLLSNALKYSPPGEGAVVGVSVRVHEAEVSIRVEDHGIGIPSDHVDRIFERFYRVQAARDRSSGGTGLGLSIVRNVAETHGGSVSVESAPAAGSTFTLRLPVTRR